MADTLNSLLHVPAGAAAPAEGEQPDHSLDEALGRINQMLANFQDSNSSHNLQSQYSAAPSSVDVNDHYSSHSHGLEMPEGESAEDVDESKPESVDDVRGQYTEMPSAPVFSAGSDDSKEREHPETSDDEMTDYMKRLMERVTGKPYEAEPVASPKKGVQAPRVEAKAESERESTVTETAVREPAKAPECREMMSTFRELAAAQASTAVNSHQQRCLLGKANSSARIGMAFSALSLAATVAGLQMHHSWLLVMAWICFALGMVALLRVGWVHISLLVARSNRNNTPSATTNAAS